MPVPEQYCKRYIQVTHRLGIGKDGGDSVGHRVSERPSQGQQLRDGQGQVSTVRRRYTDGGPDGDGSTQAEPTYVTFEPADNVDVAFLLRIGAVVEEPKGARKQSGKDSRKGD